eukprot:770301-Rhodomonas_salina.4
MSGTDLAYGAICLRLCYSLPGTDLASGAICLCLPISRLQNVAFGYPNSPPLFENVDMMVDGNADISGGNADIYGARSRSRIVLLGENGAGKTTL